MAHKLKFNKVYFIESINTSYKDGKDVPLAVGEMLEKGVKQRIQDLTKIDRNYSQMSCELIRVDGIEGWINAIGKIVGESRTGIYPIVHFICHGAFDKNAKTSGLCIADGTSPQGYIPMPWSHVAASLAMINEACHNNLMVTMSACYGYCLWGNLFDKEIRAPYYCLVSKKSKVWNYENNAMLDFYAELITSRSVLKAINALHKAAYKDQIEGIDKIEADYADETFKALLRKEYKRRETPEYIHETLKNLYEQSHVESFGWKLEDYIRRMTPVQLQMQKKKYKSIRDYKFMFDIYPEERDRFDLPETYDELMQTE